MKKLITIDSKLEAKMICDFLASKQITTVVNGSRDYVSIVTGTDLGSFEIEVESNQLEEAQKLLNELEKKDKEVESAVIEETPIRFFKKAIFLLILVSLILPVISNLLSINPFLKYLKNEKDSQRKTKSTFIYLGLNIMTFIFYYFVTMRMF